MTKEINTNKSDLRPINGLIRNAWQLYANYWPFLVKITLASYALTLALVLGFIPAVAPAAGVIFAKQKIIFIILAFAFFLIWGALLIVIGSWAQISLYQAVWQAAKNKPTSIRNIFRVTWKKWPKFLTANLLRALAIALGVILLLIPGIVFAIWFSFVSFIVVVEEKGGLSALKRSRSLVKPHFWPVLGRLVFILFLSLLVASLLSKIKLVGVIANFLISPFFLLMNCLIYEDLAQE